jgi:hypothetical protein
MKFKAKMVKMVLGDKSGDSFRVGTGEMVGKVHSANIRALKDCG